MHIETSNPGESETTAALTVVSELLSNRQLLDKLPQWRKHDLKNLNPAEQLDYHALIEILNQVYTVLLPRAERIIKKRMRIFADIAPDFRKEIIQEQRLRLLTYVRGFCWENYSDAARALAGFTLYLKKASGSFFAEEYLSPDISSGNKQSSQVYVQERPPEEALISKEAGQLVRAVFVNWQQREPRKSGMVIEKISGMTLKDISDRHHTTPAACKAIISRQKRLLFKQLVDSGVDMADRSGLQDTRYNQSSRRELLEHRRILILPLFDKMKSLLPPRVAAAAEAFYGLNGNSPLFDYQETARCLGMSEKSVRVYIPQANRMLLGKQPTSDRLGSALTDLRLYNLWKKDPEYYQISSDSVEVLKLRVEQSLSFARIGELMGYSEETARRRYRYALKMISVIHSASRQNSA